LPTTLLDRFETRALFTSAHGIAIAPLVTEPNQSLAKVVLMQNRLVIPLASAFLTLAAAHNPSHPSSHNTQPQTFLGTIKKWGDSFWLANTSEKVAARLDNPSMASHFVNQRVKVIGTIDLSSNRIAVEAIAPCT
jgi:hypothetical protein